MQFLNEENDKSARNDLINNHQMRSNSSMPKFLKKNSDSWGPSIFPSGPIKREHSQVKGKTKLKKGVSYQDQLDIQYNKGKIEFNRDMKKIAKSKLEPKERIKFAEYYDIDWPIINPIFMKPWGWPGILIVDDQYINRFIIAQYAEKYSILWEQAADGKEALLKIQNAIRKHCWKGYSLVLMDLNMPKMGGIEAAREISTRKDNKEIPKSLKIVAVTAFASESERKKWYVAGMAEFIPKPFKLDDFVRLVYKI